MKSFKLCVLICLIAVLAGSAFAASQDVPAKPCTNPVFLTIDPGHMDYAPRVAEVLARQQVKATFFVSNLNTKNGGGVLGDQWGTWWKVIAGQGHDFVSQTYDHIEWRGDAPGYRHEFRVRPGAGAFEGREFTFDQPKYCEQITHAAQRIEFFSGKKSLPLFHAPYGRTSPKLLAVTSACGYAHVAPTGAGLLANGTSLKTTIAAIRSGEVLMADLNTGTTEPWAVANLEALIVGLKARGMCFESLRKHPTFQEWISSHGG